MLSAQRKRMTGLILALLAISLGLFGHLVASAQDVTRAEDEAEIVGRLTAYEGTTMIIATLTFDVSQAEIQPGVAVDEIVKVHATPSETGVWVAREVELFVAADNDNANTNDNLGNTNDNTGNSNDNGADDNGNDDNGNDDNGNSNDNTGIDFSDENELELTGTLQEIGDDFIVVAGQRIDVTGTEIKDTLLLGLRLKIHLRLQDGQPVAREVEVDDSDGSVTIPADCAPAMPAGWTTYTIQPGDSLSAIAHGSGSTISQLALANCISDPSIVVVGVSIFVPREPVISFDNSNDNGDDNGNDNGNDNGDDHGNDNGNDNGDDHGNDNGNDNGDD